MIVACLHPDGRLTDCRHALSVGPGEVPLDDMPEGFGPWVYDPETRRAIPATPTADEREAEAVDKIPRKARGAVFVLLDELAVIAEHDSKARRIVGEAAQRIREASTT